MRLQLGMCVLALAACTEEPEELRQGVGFGDWDEYRAQQQAELSRSRASPVPEALTVSEETAGNVPVPAATAPISAIAGDAAAVSSPQTTSQYVPAAVSAEPVPLRPGTTEPNIVAFALASTHPVGTQVYPRNGSSQAFETACARYRSSDQAQIDFLKSGGPELDRKGLDPDGDGFACYWDPTAFRKARGG